MSMNALFAPFSDWRILLRSRLIDLCMKYFSFFLSFFFFFNKTNFFFKVGLGWVEVGYTVDSRYLELAYLELPLISK